MDAESYTSIAKSLNFKPDLIYLIKHLIVDLGLFLLIALTLQTNWSILAQIIVPVFMFRMFSLMHDCVHFAVSKNRILNDLIGVIGGAMCLLPYEPWKNIHITHHKWTGNIDKDPTMKLIKELPNNSNLKNTLLTFFWKSWIPGLAISQHFVFWTKSYQFILSQQSQAQRAKNSVSVLLPILFYAWVGIHNFWPGIVLYLVLVEVINFPHHLQMPMMEGNKSLIARDQHLTARSCNYPSWFSTHILNNFNLHIEHHMFPSLPWYRLPQVTQKIKPVLKDAYTEIYRSQWILDNRSKHINQVICQNIETDTQTQAA